MTQTNPDPDEEESTNERKLFTTSGGNELNHEIPEPLVEQYNLAAGTPVRYTPTQGSGIDIAMNLTVGPDVTGDQSNERKLSEPRTGGVYTRYPGRLATILGLFDNVGDDVPDDGEARTATVTAVDDTTLQVEYTPSVTPWHDRGGYDEKPDVYDLDTAYRHLWATPEQGSASYADLTPDDDFHFRLDVPVAFADAFRLEPSQRVSFHVAMVQGELGLAVHTEPDTASLPKSALGTVNKKADHITQVALYPPMVMLHALGIGVDDVKPTVRLVPGPEASTREEGNTGWFAILPDDGEGPEDSRKLQLEAETFQEAAEQADTWEGLADDLGHSFQAVRSWADRNGVEPDFGDAEA